MRLDPIFPKPHDCSINLVSVDEAAMEVRDSLNWKLATFTAVFDPMMKQVLTVQLGDYARGNLGGNPWTLPGRSVDCAEIPSASAIREIAEEAGVRLDPLLLKAVGWFARPYLKNELHNGELIILFGYKSEKRIPDLKPTSSEIKQCKMTRFDLNQWIKVPEIGEGKYELQPLRRHWIYWTDIAFRGLGHSDAELVLHCYRKASEMSKPLAVH